jgi:hypothetical protein
MAPVKAYIYAEDGSLLGFIAYTEPPPDVLELNGRFFQHHGVSRENLDEDECVQCFDYWEIEVETEMDVIHICVFCGRNASLIWYKCCPEHMTLEGQEVVCQTCVEVLHPGDPELARQ